MAVEDDVKQNTRDIASLTNTVTRIVTIVENSEKRRGEDMDVMKAVWAGIKDLNEKVGQSAGMRDDIAQIREDLRVAGHDVRTALSAIAGIPVLQDRLTEAKTEFTKEIGGVVTALAVERGRIDAIEKRNSQIDGGVKVVERLGAWIWVAIGGFITLILSNWPTIQSILSRSNGPISGE